MPALRSAVRHLAGARNPEAPRRITATRYARLDPAVRGRATLFGAALLGATALLLISACVNARSLLLSRGMARRTELAIKIALGADRPRLVRESVLEGVLLALSGTVAGLVAAASSSMPPCDRGRTPPTRIATSPQRWRPPAERSST
jgi:cell division protein FtsX